MQSFGVSAGRVSRVVDHARSTNCEPASAGSAKALTGENRIVSLHLQEVRRHSLARIVELASRFARYGHGRATALSGHGAGT